MAHRESPSKDELVLIPAIRKDSTTGYKCVNYNRGAKKFEAKVMDGGKRIFIGQFDTAEEAAIAYARSEYGRADAAKMKQTRPAPSAVGAAAVRQAEKEGLTLATSANKSGYKGVFNNPKEHGSNKFTLQGLTLVTSCNSNSGYKDVSRRASRKYKLHVWEGGKDVHLGVFGTAEEAALFSIRQAELSAINDS
ncbi:hypothetical protein EMIHUDRAFT_230985 [Emiliania huxleyi CCMP1516]|uniref:AP2/ERF domain-containing protein n=2 Tax=Emiliania huxleyi TaxID=2903 RepID=A0A0D3K9I3_EMIH1|nr:hypothetical protein EMIHUDRAFT_230985 [Emiliania huxleyi CCMP1516]EOD32418.1 hypothetical protein EMIHUDRAFT_230985 [Emiliania huxleyi CCMP1516]|eukprot:XP_005784847.1 hypothetical protein EMIHUDRAFT_230985 [Emiliania huxleyi CCMP1516]